MLAKPPGLLVNIMLNCFAEAVTLNLWTFCHLGCKVKGYMKPLRLSRLATHLCLARSPKGPNSPWDGDFVPSSGGVQVCLEAVKLNIKIHHYKYDKFETKPQSGILMVSFKAPCKMSECNFCPVPGDSRLYKLPAQLFTLRGRACYCLAFITTDFATLAGSAVACL